MFLVGSSNTAEPDLPEPEPEQEPTPEFATDSKSNVTAPHSDPAAPENILGQEQCTENG